MNLTSIKEDIKQSLRNAREAIIGRGGEISPTAGLKDLPEAIYKIPADASLAYQVDDTVAYRKIVPSGAEEFAQVAKVGGMSYKCPVTNYLKITGVKRGDVGDGVVINDDGSVTILSYDLDTSIKGSVELNFEATPGDYYFFATGDDISDGVTVTIFSEFIDENGNQDGITNTLGSQVKGDVGFDSLIVDFGDGDGGYGYGTPLTFRLWLAKTTEGIFEGLRDTKVTEMRSEHGNLFNFDNIYNNFKRENNTINVTAKAYHVDLFSGTSGDNTLFPPELRNNLIYLSKGTYYVYFDIDFYEDEVAEENKDLYARRVLPDGSHKWVPVEGTSTTKIYNGTKVVVEEDGYITLRRLINKRCTISNLMISRTPRTEYVPYNPSILDIPEDLRRFLEQHGYGRGVSGYPNYIDLERGVFVQNTYRKVFDGTEEWNAVETKYGKYRLYVRITNYIMPTSVTKIAPILCDKYDTQSSDYTYLETGSSVAATTEQYRLYFYDINFNNGDVTDWKAHLAELYASGKPLTVEYALAEPIEVDISAYLKDDITFLQVEGGGTITAVNEYEYDAPSTINYIAKVGG